MNNGPLFGFVASIDLPTIRRRAVLEILWVAINICDESLFQDIGVLLNRQEALDNGDRNRNVAFVLIAHAD